MRGTAYRFGTNILQIIYDEHRSNPKHAPDFAEIARDLDPQSFKLNFSFKGHKDKHAEASIIRTAYLWAFSVLGYGFLLNEKFRLCKRTNKQPRETDIAPFRNI